MTAHTLASIVAVDDAKTGDWFVVSVKCEESAMWT